MKRRSFLLALTLAGCGDIQRYLDSKPLEAPAIMSPTFMVNEIMRLADVRPGDVLYDLGCGDGRIVIEAARRGALGVGVDIDAGQIALANKAAAAAGVSARVRFAVGDIFDADLRDATVVTLYLSDEANVRLRPKLQRELKRGSRVISHQFTMGDWKPDLTLTAGGRNLFLWVM